MNFQIIDWCILFAYLAGSMYAGLRARKYVEDMEGYFVAGRRVKVALGSATLIATEIGIVTFMYFGELGYVTGFSCFILGIIGFFGYMVIGKTGFIVSGLRALKIVTIPEFYEMRYGRGVRLLGGILLFLGGVLNMGIFLKMDGLFLTQAMGLGQGMLFAVMTVMLIVVVSYTILGGMFSVVVTDFIQFVVLSFGMLIATLFVLANVSLSDMANAVMTHLGENGVNPVTNPRFGWSFIFWMLIGSVAVSALNQPAASKAFASESPEVGRKVFLYTGITLAGRYGADVLGRCRLDDVRSIGRLDDGNAEASRNCCSQWTSRTDDRRYARGIHVHLQRVHACLEFGGDAGHHRSDQEERLFRTSHPPSHQDYYGVDRLVHTGVRALVRDSGDGFSIHGDHRGDVCGRCVRVCCRGIVLEEGEHRGCLCFAGIRRRSARGISHP